MGRITVLGGILYGDSLGDVVLVAPGWSMLALMSPKLWLAVLLAAVLAFSHFTVYRAGRAAVRIQWDAQKLVDAESARKAIEANRAIEAQRQKQTQEAIDESKKREVVLRADADGARSALQRLRNAVRTASGPVPSNTANPVSGPATAPELLADCAAKYQSMGELADQHSSDVRTLTDAWPKR